MVTMDRQLLQKMINEDKYGLLNIDYEIHSGCGAREKIRAVSLRAAKQMATKKGYGVCTPVWILGFQGKLLTIKDSSANTWS